VKPEERRGEKSVWRGVISEWHSILTGAKGQKYSAFRSPKQCPLMSVVKVDGSKGKVLGSEEGKTLGGEFCYE
jgi:hypothetical protein